MDEAESEPKIKLKPEVKDVFLTALRSGDYEQARGELRRDGGFCCLGVLTDLYLKAHELNWEEGFQYMSFLPDAVGEWATQGDQPVNNFTLERAGYTEKASVINDNGFLFAEIADLIEEQL